MTKSPTSSYSRLNQLLKVIIVLILALFIFLHLTPKMAVRAKLLEQGFFRSAFTSTILLVNEKPYRITHEIGVSDDEDMQIGKVYYVRPTPIPVNQFSDLRPNRYIVKTFVLSFAEVSPYMY